MNFVINYNDTECVLSRTAAIWSLTMKKTYRAIFFLFVLGILILIIGAQQPYTFSSGIGGEANYNFHASLGIGGGVIILSLLYLEALRKNKKYFDQAVSSFIQRAEAAKSVASEVVISSSSLKFSNFEETSEVKWSLFIFYKIYNGYVALYKQRNAPSYLVELKKLNLEEQNEFIQFLERRYPKKTS